MKKIFLPNFVPVWDYLKAAGAGLCARVFDFTIRRFKVEKFVI
jgi:hypothetical protein